MNGGVTLRDIFVLIFYYRRLIGICLGLGLIIGCIAAIATPSYYPAEGLLVLRPEAESSAVLSPNGSIVGLPQADLVQRTIASDVAILGSDPVLRAVVASSAHPPRAGDDRAMEKAVRKIRRRLTVAAEPDSDIIQVTYKDPNRETAIKTVSALIQAYANQRATVYETNVGDVQQRELQRYASQLREIDGQIESTKAQANVLDIGQDIQLTTARLDSLLSGAAKAREQQAAIEAELKAACAELARTPQLVLESQDTSNARPNDDIYNTLARLRQERQHVVEQYTEHWPGLRDLDARIAAAVEQQRATQQARSLTERRARNPIVDQIEQKASGLRIELKAVTAQIAQIAQALPEIQERMATLRAADAQLHDLQRARDIMEGEYKQLSMNVVTAHLKDQVLGEHNGSVHVLQPATAPARPVGRWPLLILGGLGLGAFGAMVSCVAAALMRQTFITPDEAARNLGLPVVAEAPDPAVSGEVFRSEILLLTELVSETTIQGRPLKSLRVVGTEPEDRRQVAAALAEALASPGRASTLIVDLTREGALRTAAGGEVRRLPKGDGDVVVTQTGVDRVWTAVSGHLTNAAGLPAVFQAVAPEFDHVVVVGDDDVQGQKATRRAYQLVDANLMIVRASNSRGPVLRHLRENILAAGGDLLGMVFLGRRHYIPKRIYQWL